VVDGRPEYPAEEMEKAEIIDECENVTPDCDDFSVMVCYNCCYLSVDAYLHRGLLGAFSIIFKFLVRTDFLVALFVKFLFWSCALDLTGHSPVSERTSNCCLSLFVDLICFSVKLLLYLLLYCSLLLNIAVYIAKLLCTYTVSGKKRPPP